VLTQSAFVAAAPKNPSQSADDADSSRILGGRHPSAHADTAERRNEHP
jgi:hypothetical protein